MVQVWPETRNVPALEKFLLLHSIASTYQLAQVLLSFKVGHSVRLTLPFVDYPTPRGAAAVGAESPVEPGKVSSSTASVRPPTTLVVHWGTLNPESFTSEKKKNKKGRAKPRLEVAVRTNQGLFGRFYCYKYGEVGEKTRERQRSLSSISFFGTESGELGASGRPTPGQQ